MSFMTTLSEKATLTPSKVPTYLMKGPSFLFALTHGAPQVANLDCTEVPGSFQSDSHFPKLWKGLTSRSEATKSNKQKTRLLKRVRRGWKAVSQTSTGRVTTRQSPLASRPASSLLTNKASPALGPLMQAVGNAEVVSRSLSSGTRARRPCSKPTLPHTTQGKRLNFLA